MNSKLYLRVYLRCTLALFQLLPSAESFAKSRNISPHSSENAKLSPERSLKDAHGSDISEQIESMLKGHSYELSIRPEKNGTATRVGINILIESITDISEKNMDVTFTLRFHETWRDERLRFKSDDKNSSIVLASRLIDKIWIPDLYIVGSKDSFIHKTTVNNVVLRLFCDGTIFYSVKITSTVACQMNLYNFPLDIENCSIVLQSLGYTSEELVLYWLVNRQKDNLFMDTGLVTNMPKYQLLHHKFHSSNVTYEGIHLIPDVERSQLKVTFELKRYPLSVFFQSYFPAMAMVLLAGMGMWIDPKSVPARVALGVTSVLTISTIITGLKATLPKVSYLTAMDIYLWVCFLFVFSTVIEFCILNYLMTKSKRYGTHQATYNQKASWNPSFQACKLVRKMTCGACSRCDFIFRISYFLAFTAFNVIYWVYYACITQHDAND